jgi:lipopolysaccharide export system protein LptA
MRTLAFALAIALQQNFVSFESTTHAFRLENFDRVYTELDGTLRGEVSGKPFALHWRDRGIVVSGRSATVQAKQNGVGDYVLTSANIGGSASISQDTQTAYQFAVETAKAGNTTPPPAPVDRSQMTVTSDALSYAGDDKQGTITIPGAFVFTRQAHTVGTVTKKAEKGSVAKKAEKVPQVSDDNMQLHASSGTLTFAAEPKDIDSIRSGVLEGPITAHMVRDSVTNGQPDPQSVIDAAADHAEFSGDSHTLTLTGNVAVDGKEDVYAGSARAAKAVITFGPRGRVLRIELTGTPTETKIDKRPPPAHVIRIAGLKDWSIDLRLPILQSFNPSILQRWCVA